MEKTKNIVINITFGFFMFYMIYLNNIGGLKTKLDFFLSLMAIMISILLLVSKNIIILDFVHFLYTFVYLFTVSFISKNIYLLGLNILMLLVIIFTRYYFSNCILNEKQNNTGFFTDLNDVISKYIVFWDWHYLYPLLLLVSTGRFIKLKWY